MKPDRLINPRLQYRFNAAAWQRDEDQTTILVAREVIRGGDGISEPDNGNMVLLEMNADGQIMHEDVVWQYTNGVQALEDPRAMVLKDGRVRLGLTAVAADHNPYPAVITLDAKYFRAKLPEAVLITEFGPGKNTTPIKDDILFCRREGEADNHRLVEFSFDGQRSVGLSEINFPKGIEWASWRIGTALSPFWINKEEALMIIHGIQKVDGKFIYSLGRAKLYQTSGKFSAGKYEVEVDPSPILTPDDFLNEDGSPMVEELHPQLRRVVYACGGVMKKQLGQLVLALYVNVGDRQTVEVRFPWKDLISGWWSY